MVRKAVFPMARFGTWFLPTTKVMKWSSKTGQRAKMYPT